MNTQNTELAKVKARIKALMERTVDRGCSEQEAIVAAGMVGKLLQQYNLNMSEIDVREEKCITVRATTDSMTRNEMWAVAFEIGKFCSCKVWYTGGHGVRGTYHYFGHESDAQMAEYLFRVVSEAIRSGTEVFKRSATYRNSEAKRLSSDSFKRAMARRIAARLVEMRNAAAESLRQSEQAKRDATREQAAKAFEVENAERYAAVKSVQDKLARGIAGTNLDFEITTRFEAERMAAAERALGQTSLIVLKGQLVEHEFENLGMKITTVKVARRVFDGSSYAAGTAAGDRVNLNRPLSSDRGHLQIG
jgi:hypothetical protein